MFDATTVINDVVILAGIFGLGKSGLLQFVVKNEGKIVKGVEAGAEVIAEVAKTPVAKAIEVDLHHQLNNALNQAQNSEIGRVVGAALIAADDAYSNLSDPKKSALIAEVIDRLPKEYNVTPAMVEDFIKANEKLAADIKSSETYQQADKFTSILQAKAAAQTASAEPATDAEQTKTSA